MGTPPRRLNGYPRTKSAPSLYGSYRVLKKNGVDGVKMFLMCCSSALISLPDGSLATYITKSTCALHIQALDQRRSRRDWTKEDARVSQYRAKKYMDVGSNNSKVEPLQSTTKLSVYLVFVNETCSLTHNVSENTSICSWTSQKDSQRKYILFVRSVL